MDALSSVVLYAGDLELDCHPFPHCIIKNFLGSENFVENLQRELLGLNFHEKSNDLYKFKQVAVKPIVSLIYSGRFELLSGINLAVLLFPSSQTT